MRSATPAALALVIAFATAPAAAQTRTVVSAATSRPQLAVGAYLGEINGQWEGPGNDLGGIARLGIGRATFIDAEIGGVEGAGSAGESLRLGLGVGFRLQGIGPLSPYLTIGGGQLRSEEFIDTGYLEAGAGLELRLRGGLAIVGDARMSHALDEIGANPAGRATRWRAMLLFYL